ncbi:hypothetical protein TWF696_009055 [Orbilia brochopaga]|uniref:Uncharacterized protein n=1 Tax=Orbilia brochopaga TaxID=3140254 RepID=A0AAV9UF13_9PEZI
MQFKMKKAIARLFGKKTPKGEHVYSRMTMLVAPLTTNLALPELPPSSVAASPSPSSKPELITVPTLAPVVSPVLSVPAYDQEGLARIDYVACPAWQQSLSCSQMSQNTTRKKRHYTFAKLTKRGTRAPTMPVGPKRLAALEAYEELDARALPISHPLPQFSGAAAGLEEPSSQDLMTRLKKSEMQPQKAKTANRFRIFKQYGKTIVKKLAATAEKLAARSHMVRPLHPSPSSARLTAGWVARGWGREGVDPWLQPRVSSPHLYGRDRHATSLPTHEQRSNSNQITRPFPPSPFWTGLTSEAEAAKERIRYREFRRDT